MSPSQLIKERAAQLGFDKCGITSACRMAEDSEYLNQWITHGYGADLGYMSKNLDVRHNPSLLVEDARSVIVCLISYKTDVISPYIASYALSTDYHYTLKERLRELCHYTNELFPSTEARVFVDSAPIFERSLAVMAGLGWIGRNSMLINRELGSFTFIATIITTAELEYDSAYKENHCAGCRRCIENCPTLAINYNKTIDVRRCLSYHTIENRTSIPPEIVRQSTEMFFGCDICQNVCPHNMKVVSRNQDIFKPMEGVVDLTSTDFLLMTGSEFKRRFATSPLSRCGLKKIKETINNRCCYFEK